MRSLIIPVGTSPAHVLRMVLSSPKDRFDKIILRTTDATSEYGQRILKIVSSEGYEANVVKSTDLESYLEFLGGDWEFDLALGPGRKKDHLSIIRAAISATGCVPRICVRFVKKSGGVTRRKKNLSEESFRILRKSADLTEESYPLPKICMAMACKIYNVDSDYFDKPWLEWDPGTCKVLLNAEAPQRKDETIEALKDNRNHQKAKREDKVVARRWETQWRRRLDEQIENFGMHAVVANLPPDFPKADPSAGTPYHWDTTKTRMNMHHFKG